MPWSNSTFRSRRSELAPPQRVERNTNHIWAVRDCGTANRLLHVRMHRKKMLTVYAGMKTKSHVCSASSRLVVDPARTHNTTDPLNPNRPQSATVPATYSVVLWLEAHPREARDWLPPRRNHSSPRACPHIWDHKAHHLDSIPHQDLPSISVAISRRPQ
jgi:hypothetical protein